MARRCAWRGPLRWAATRREDFETTNHARGSVCEGELALDADGRILGLRARIGLAAGRIADERGGRLAVEPRARCCPAPT